jgi:hypothetical protein
MTVPSNSNATENSKTMEHGKAKEAKLAKQQKEKATKTKAKASLKAKKLKEQEQDRNDWEALEQLGEERKARAAEKQKQADEEAQIKEQNHEAIQHCVKSIVLTEQKEKTKERKHEAFKKHLETILGVDSMIRANLSASESAMLTNGADTESSSSSITDAHRIPMPLSGSTESAGMSSSSHQEEGIDTPGSPGSETVRSSPVSGTVNKNAEDKLTVKPKDKQKLRSSSLGTIEDTSEFAITPIMGLHRCLKPAEDAKKRANADALSEFLAAWADGLEADLEKKSPNKPMAPSERLGTIKPGGRDWIPIPTDKQFLFSEVTRVPVLAMPVGMETQVIRGAVNGDLSGSQEFKKEEIGIYKGDGFPIIYRKFSPSIYRHMTATKSH